MKKIALAGVGCVIGAAVVAGLVTSGAPHAETAPAQEQQMMDFTTPDMSDRNRFDPLTGCEKPPRPSWTENVTLRDMNKYSLLADLYDLNRLSRIIATKSCPCEIKWPSWDEAEKQLNELIEGLNNDQIAELMYQKSSEAAKVNNESYDICAAYWKQHK